jgi:competence protein ComEC
VERARQAVRDAVFEHVANRKTAGILAALVTGDQNAIVVSVNKTRVESRS